MERNDWEVVTYLPITSVHTMQVSLVTFQNSCGVILLPLLKMRQVLFSVLLCMNITLIAQPSNFADLVFQKTDYNRWKGTCSVKTSLFQTAVFTISPAKEIMSGSWRNDIHPTSVWAGVEADSGYVDSTIWKNGAQVKAKVKVANSYVDSTIEIEIYADGSGVLRSQDGWFAIERFSLLPDQLKFQVNISQEVQPSKLDRDIITRASTILSSASVWNRADNRKCKPTDSKWSIYCSMVQATNDVTGGFHHRRPALQLIRQLVEERTKNKNYRHRLMDYNNDTSTEFSDVVVLFRQALERIH